MRTVGLLLCLILPLPIAWAEDNTARDESPDAPIVAENPRDALNIIERCYIRTLNNATPGTAASQIRRECDPDNHSQHGENEYALRGRLALERVSQYNPFVLTPHRRNYLMPVSYMSNRKAHNPPTPGVPDSGTNDNDLKNLEAKFQVSIKSPLIDDFWNGSTLYVAFTATSFWQVYNRELSRPFRETNYEPEIFVAKPVDWQIGGIDSELISFGYWHESNGRDLPTSRSWDRLFVSYIFRTGSWYFELKPWWRKPESSSKPSSSPRRDDNPDIEKYLGHFELTMVKPMGNHVFELMLRNNLRKDTNRGSATVDYTFPLSRRFKGIVQVHTGYGDSLINYSDYENRVSLGITLTDTF